MLVSVYNVKEKKICIVGKKNREGKGGLEYTIDEWKYPHYGQR